MFFTHNITVKLMSINLQCFPGPHAIVYTFIVHVLYFCNRFSYLWIHALPFSIVCIFLFFLLSFSLLMSIRILPLQKSSNRTWKSPYPQWLVSSSIRIMWLLKWKSECRMIRITAPIAAYHMVPGASQIIIMLYPGVNYGCINDWPVSQEPIHNAFIKPGWEGKP